MKVVKKDIVNRKARKSVKQTAEARRLRGSRKAANVEIRSKRGSGKFKYEKWSHKVGHHPVGEWYGEPEKRAAEQVKAV